MYLSSFSFKNNQKIPKKFTCEGEDISPALQWSSVPEGIKSFALICDDPDAPGKTWVHWVVYNLPADISGLAEGVTIKSLGGLEGTNDFGKTTYGGPCPPKGHGMHHYHFKLYALDVKLDLPAGVKKEQVLQAMQGHVLKEAKLTGLYERA